MVVAYSSVKIENEALNIKYKALEESLAVTKALVVTLEKEKGDLAAELKATAVERDDLKSERNAAVSRADKLESGNSNME